MKRISLRIGIGIAVGLAAAASAQSTRPGWGATPYADENGTGITFRAWAPGATQLTVAGEFNGWNTTATPLVPESGAGGVWSRDVPDARVGHAYKYLVDGRWKADPMGRAFDGGPTANTVVTEPTTPVDDGFVAPPYAQMVIYELHPGTFCDPDPHDGQPGTLLDAIACLDAVADLGFNAIQLMPVNEFPHAYSWGYNPVGALAVEASYGGLAALRSFVAAAHARGMAVLGDLVVNHWGFLPSDQFDVYGFDSASGAGSYFFDGAPQATPWGPRPHYGEPVVRHMILENIRLLMDAGMDGIRWDSPQHIFLDASNQPVPHATNMVAEAVALIRAYGGISIAENARSQMMAAFDGDWDYAARANILSDLINQPTTRVLDDALLGIQPHQVIPVESHDTCGLLNSGELRNAARFEAAAPGRVEQNRRLTMMTAAAVILSRGIPMLFMGAEWGETQTWHDDRPLARTTNAVSSFTRELIRLRRNLDGLSPGLTTTNIAVSSGILPAGIQMRRGPTSNAVLVLFHTGSNLYSRPTTFPATGHWFCVLSSDDTRFGGQGRGTLHLHLTNSTSASVQLPPHGTMVFSRVLPPGDLDGDGLPNDWEFTHFGGPTNALPHADADSDGMTNADEWRAGTDPRDADSLLAVLGLEPMPDGLRLRWKGAADRDHIICAATMPEGPWSPIVGASAVGQSMRTNELVGAQAGFFRIECPER